MFHGYKIAKLDDLYNNQFALGIKSDSGLSKKIITKINNGIKSFGLPYKECISMFPNSFFVMQTKNVLRAWLFDLCKLSKVDVKELEDAGYVVVKFNSSGICRGLSRNRGAMFPDEVEDYETWSISEELNKNFNPIVYPDLPSSEVEYTKNMYYKSYI